jgi:hypothetical protein
MPFNSIVQNTSIEVVLDTTDIGGTTATSKYVDMKNFGTVAFVVELGATLEGTPDGWSTTDSLDEFYLVQATDAAGTSSKAIGTGTNGVFQVDRTDAQTGAAGDILAIELHTEALDMDNNFSFVAAVVVEDSNTAADNVTIVAVRHNARFAHKNLTINGTNAAFYIG